MIVLVIVYENCVCHGYQKKIISRQQPPGKGSPKLSHDPMGTYGKGESENVYVLIMVKVCSKEPKTNLCDISNYAYWQGSNQIGLGGSF